MILFKPSPIYIYIYYQFVLQEYISWSNIASKRTPGCQEKSILSKPYQW